MEFEISYYRKFKAHLTQIAKRFALDPDKIKVEFFTPNSQAILIERVKDYDFKIHINLEEDRIISIQPLQKNSNGSLEKLRKKYRRFMK